MYENKNSFYLFSVFKKLNTKYYSNKIKIPQNILKFSAIIFVMLFVMFWWLGEQLAEICR